MTATTHTEAATDRARHWAPKLKALADENRLTIALLLAEGEHSVKDLQDVTDLSQTLVSHHLKLMRDHHLVSVRVAGRSNYYSLCCGELRAIIDALSSAGSDVCR